MYEIDESVYQRFEAKNNMIFRRLWDKSLSTYGQMFHTNIMKHIQSGKEGYSHLDFALVEAGWTVYEKFPYAFAWARGPQYGSDYGTEWQKSKIKIEDPQEITYKIKKVAGFYGASLVGITDINNKWIYKTGFIRPSQKSEKDSKGDLREGKKEGLSVLEQPIELPDGINKAIVMAIEMDQDAISTSPAQPAAAAASIAYSKMAFVISCIGEFIRNLGFRAIQCGNDTALSIPLAIDAGLGAVGRLGLLITPEFGPRVRICKVFTDMPLVSDSPNITFINTIAKYCGTCLKCAEECETEAISKEKEPNYNSVNISNNPGIKKYYIDGEKCFEYWIENSSDCGKCIAVCPFSKIKKFLTPNEFWNKE
ncbi:MAG: reductive dehalogenase [Promethearchaeota archaeon]|jgi:reductive dehalogenase